MSNWYIDYHRALELRLLGIGVMFGIVWPILLLLVTGARRLAWHLARLAHGGEKAWPSRQRTIH
jgi:hypothetical protein